MEQLVRAAIDGQQAAFEQLVEAEKSKLLAKAYSYVGNKEDASDIVQETLLQAFKSMHQLKEPKYFSTWLFKILIRQCFAFLRLKKRTLVVETELIQQQLIEQEQSMNYEIVHEALSLLRKDYQTVLILFYFYDFKVQEITYLLDKPINTIKMYLHRGRIQLKKQLEQRMNKPIKQKEVIHMLKEQLAKLALNFVSIPDNYQLLVEDYSIEQATFMWSTDDLEEGIEVSLDPNGKLLDLTRPPSTTGTLVTTQQQQAIAEQFLTEQYTEALDYLTVSTIIEKEDETKFLYEQFVGGYPLESYYTKIIVSKFGEIIDFKYNGYTKAPPKFPTQLASKDRILQQLFKAPWTLSMKYLVSDNYSVAQSGLYPIYESPIVYQSFNAIDGKALFEEEVEEDVASFTKFPYVQPLEKQTTLENIIGVTDCMEKLREVEMDENTLGIVWRKKDWKAPKDKSMKNFLLERMEDTVKAKVDKHSRKLKEFMWFKERTGELDLSFEACCDIACTFIATYFKEYVPYVQLQIKKPSFNEVNRAFFTFPLHVAHGLQIEGEHFYVGVDKTTGFIDTFRSPRIDLELLYSYDSPTIQPIENVIPVLKEADAFLQWSRQYDENKNDEVLQYRLGQSETKQRIVGIDATTGQLIVSKF
ncbi:sigma-70 family RNA polymerase sigma factor [Viridibacillus arvi]|uniref:sigma-70 family RNA polymerase sigma factor n=1 Tax=Viridibacillus arvi TaxID=263475 RepID=UPI003D05EC4E